MTAQPPYTKKKNSGQVLLIVTLVMAAVLTIGLSVASRSIVDIRLSGQEEEAARALSAAEAGLEQALQANLAAGSSLPADEVGGAIYNVQAVAQGGGSDFDFGGAELIRGESRSAWLVEYLGEGSFNEGGSTFPATGTLTFCWGEDTTLDSTTPALEATLIYKTSGSFRIARGAYDPNNTRRTGGFTDADDKDGGNCNANLAFAKTVTLASLGVPAGSIPYLLSMKLIYNDVTEPISLAGSSDLPAQGKCYVSSAEIPESGVTRRVQQCEFYEFPAGVFDFLIFSEADLEQV